MAYDMDAFGRMNAADRRAALGIKSSHLPNEGIDSRKVHGVYLFLEDKSNMRGFKRQRMQAVCPVCDERFAAGNLAQHHLIHTAEGRKKLEKRRRPVLVTSIKVL